jgi:hypothetical protein
VLAHDRATAAGSRRLRATQSSSNCSALSTIAYDASRRTHSIFNAQFARRVIFA